MSTSVGAAIRQGRVAAFTVVGGHGTRLAFDAPKRAFDFSPSFALDAEELKDTLTPQSVTLDDGPILLS